MDDKQQAESCSEVVERLAECLTKHWVCRSIADEPHWEIVGFDREKATAILHSWREQIRKETK